MAQEQSSSTVDLQSKLIELSASKAFIADEFLLWLWTLAETEKGFWVKSSLGKKSVFVDLWVDDRVLLKDSGMAGAEHSIRGGDPSNSIEAAYGLHAGRCVKELKVGMQIPDLGDFFLLASKDLKLRQLKLPDLEIEMGDESSEHSLTFLRVNRHKWYIKFSMSYFRTL